MLEKSKIFYKNLFLPGTKLNFGQNLLSKNNNEKAITFISEKLGQKIQLKVAASTIRTVEKKGGLDDFLVSTPNSKLPEKAKRLLHTTRLRMV